MLLGEVLSGWWKERGIIGNTLSELKTFLSWILLVTKLNSSVL